MERPVSGPDGVLAKTRPDLVDEATNSLGVVNSDPAGKDDILTLNEIAVPVNRPVRLRLKSKDVIHSFFLPNFRVKQDVVPGMTPEVVFVPTRTGHFEIACAELCGLAHYRMRAFFNVLTEEEFENWLRLQAAAKDPMTPSTAPGLLRRRLPPDRMRRVRPADTSPVSSAATCSVPITRLSASSTSSRG